MIQVALVIALLSSLLAGCRPAATSDSLQAVHTPLKIDDVETDLIAQIREAGYPYLRFYRTEIKNHANVPIRIVWFDGYFENQGQWTASNVRNKVLRTKDFRDWYSRDDMTEDGWIAPGGTAACQVNWHWSETPDPTRTKWAYVGVDRQGNDYFCEAVVPDIEPVQIK